MAKKYEVTITKKVGSCDNELFEKMAKNGDLTSIKLSELIGSSVKIKGYAVCTIETDEKKFNINYFDTEEYGLISSGSEIFLTSVVNYFGDVEYVRLVEVKTKKGKTYKAVPILLKKEITENKEETTENKEETGDLPY